MSNEQPAWAAALERRLDAAMDGGAAGIRGEMAQFRRDVARCLDALEAVVWAHHLSRRAAP
jgi:hypothetical protein